MKETAVAPVKPVPMIVTALPTTAPVAGVKLAIVGTGVGGGDGGGGGGGGGVWVTPDAVVPFGPLPAPLHPSMSATANTAARTARLWCT